MTHHASTASALPVAGLITHKTYTIRRSTMLLGLSWLVLTTAGAGASGWYIFSKDDLAAKLVARETARQYAYEDRIAALRADVDRLASRALLDQDGVEARVDELTTRQAELEARQSLVAALADTLQTGGLVSLPKPPLRARVIKPEQPIRASGVTSFAPIMPNKPMPAPDMPSLRGAEAVADPSWQSGEAQPAIPPAKRVEATLERIGRNIDRTSLSQIAALKDMDETLETAQRKLRGALSETGIDTDRLATQIGVASGVGGPFVPIKIDASAGPFEARLASLQPRIAAVMRLRGLSEKLPLGRPMNADTEFTSNYGYRLDPFTRSPAMHTGVDFRGEPGSPIKATGPGKVVTAEYSGGYGNMVEIEHAGGITTRYAHMSAISVSVGQSVATGAVVGKVGSTGRSTGPHLHYETRIDDEPLDPTRFLKAGARLEAKS